MGCNKFIIRNISSFFLSIWCRRLNAILAVMTKSSGKIFQVRLARWISPGWAVKTVTWWGDNYQIVRCESLASLSIVVSRTTNLYSVSISLYKSQPNFYWSSDLNFRKNKKKSEIFGSLEISDRFLECTQVKYQSSTIKRPIGIKGNKKHHCKGIMHARPGSICKKIINRTKFLPKDPKYHSNDIYTVVSPWQGWGIGDAMKICHHYFLSPTKVTKIDFALSLFWSTTNRGSRKQNVKRGHRMTTEF